MKNERKSLSPGTLLAPIPPAMVTVGDMENSNIINIAWTGILSTIPPKTYVSIRPSRHSYGILKEGGEFVINLPSADLARTVDYVGIYTGAKVDKFEKCGLTKQKSDKVAPPPIAECPIALECRVTEILPMGSHDVFMADIVSVSCKGELIDEDGKMHFERANLLAYAHGEYYTLGEVIGRFGFSTDKPKKAAKPKSAPKTETKIADKPKATKPATQQEKPEERKRPFYENIPKKGAKKSTPARKKKK